MVTPAKLPTKLHLKYIEIITKGKEYYYKNPLIMKYMINNLFRKNTKESIENYINIPEPNMSTEFLVQTPIEKMIYDNALLSRLYLHAFQITSNHEFKRTAERTLNHIIDDLASPEGGFYSALDADSEGEEGTFYIWTTEEIRESLGNDLAATFEAYYGVSDSGNFEGKNILHISQHFEEISGEKENDQILAKLENARNLLLQARESREHPFRDEKILS